MIRVPRISAAWYGAFAPGAHVHIWTIAAMALQLAGDEAAAQSWADKIRDRQPNHSKEMFFRSFPLREAGVRERATDALSKLGF